jgi:hypothetical protein
VYRNASANLQHAARKERQPWLYTADGQENRTDEQRREDLRSALTSINDLLRSGDLSPDERRELNAKKLPLEDEARELRKKLNERQTLEQQRSFERQFIEVCRARLPGLQFKQLAAEARARVKAEMANDNGKLDETG